MSINMRGKDRRKHSSTDIQLERGGGERQGLYNSPGLVIISVIFQ